MKVLLSKFKLVSVSVLSLMFVLAVTMSSCSTKESTEGTDVEVVEEEPEVEVIEEVSEGDEHPVDGGEHPSDSTKSDSEHPSEHPDN